jgi:CubicO group peptidase (beta-lactamase class C family)
VMVIYNGAVIAQWGQTSRRYMCHSVRKSLLSALYGIAVEEGHIDIDETIGSIGIDEISPLTEVEKSAKVSDLLKARSGVYLPAAYETLSMKKNRIRRGSHKPGAHYYYNNWDFNTLATIYNKKTSGDLFKSFEDEIASPLQMQDFELRHTYYHLEPENSRHAAYPFRMSARDLARFGLMFLNQGRWQQKQIVTSDWVSESTKPYSTFPNGGYGYMWWTLSHQGQLGKLGTYAAFGYGGHAIYVVPEANLVFVHRANTYGGRGKHVNNVAIQNMLLEVLKARTGPPLTAPKLITLDNPQVNAPDQALSKTQISGLIGKYFKDGHVVTVRELDGRLETTSPRWGNYLLLARTPTEFEAEDAQNRVEFDLDANGSATTIRIWFRQDESYEMHRVP